MKTKTLVLGLATLASVSLLAALPVQAADDPLTSNSVGEFEVTKGDLTLVAVPTFAFEGTTVKTLVTSKADLAYKNDTIKNGTTTGTNLTVSDYRGSDQTGCNLTAKMSAFTNGSTTIKGSLTYVTKNTADNAVDNAAAGTVTDTDSSVWDNTKAKTAGVGSATVGTTTGTKLTLSPMTSVATGTYDADITWTLSATASD